MKKRGSPAGENLPAPSPSAKLNLSKVPGAKLKLSVGSLPVKGSLTGLVDASQAHYLITMFGIVLAAAAGIGGAVLMLHATRDALTVYAGLALALVAAVLIAICSGRAVTERKHVEGEPGDSQGTNAD